MDSDTRGAIVIGADIGGLATAVGLHRSGFQVRVYEQAASAQPVGAGPLTVAVPRRRVVADDDVTTQVSRPGAG